MIFTRTKRTAQKVADDLAERGFKVGAVHGDLGQVAREKALKSFREGDVDVLVATDVAARGIDIDDITHVINYQIPEDEQAYVHRIGRTGRAGKTGIAITLVDWDELERWSMINRVLQLDCPDPAETYSTSAHFYEELGIPAGAGGSIGDARKTHGARPPRSTEDKPRTPRSGAPRQRTRAGKSNGAATSNGGTSNGAATSNGGTSNGGAGAPKTDTDGEGTGARRRRRRRGPRKPAEAGTSAS